MYLEGEKYVIKTKLKGYLVEVFPIYIHWTYSERYIWSDASAISILCAILRFGALTTMIYYASYLLLFLSK